jgi:hypothetical protein
MSDTYNIFISHRGIDDEHVLRLKQRLKDQGNKIRNSSIDSTKYQDKIPPDAVVARYLRIGVKWAGTFICLIGEDTHNSAWVNYEIRRAYLDKKPIIGIYKHGCAGNVELPEALKRYNHSIIGWNSLGKLQNIMSGTTTLEENPNASITTPIYNIIRIPC